MSANPSQSGHRNAPTVMRSWDPKLNLTLLVVALLNGCGVSHQFLPSRPLDKEDWQITFTWSYDLDNLSRPNIIPDVNAYLGIGKDYNFGFGAQPPFIINHFTIARYFVNEEKESLAGYFHLNGMVNNPGLELGSMYTRNHGSFDQSFTFGIGYGHSLLWPLLLTHEQISNLTPLKSSLIPIFKWSLYGKSVGVSFIHHDGLTNGFRSDLRGRIAMEDDTLLVLASADILSIQPDGIVLLNSDSLLFEPLGFGSQILRSCVDCFRDFPSHYVRWLGERFQIYHVIEFDNLAIIDYDAIIRQWENADSVVITRYAPGLAQKVSRTRSLLFDNSIGVAYIDRDN